MTELLEQPTRTTPFEAKTIEKVVYLIIFVSVAPVAIGAIRQRMAAKKAAAAATPGAD